MTDSEPNEKKPDIQWKRPEDAQLISIFDAQDRVTSRIRQGAEKIGSHKIFERLTGAAAIMGAVIHSVGHEEEGQKLSRLMRVRAEIAGSDLVKQSTEVQRSIDMIEGLVGGGIDTYMALDLKGRIYGINDAITDSTGFETDFLQDKLFDQIVHEEDTESVTNWLQAALEGKNEKLEFRIKAADESVRWMNGSPNTLHNRSGETYGFIVRMNDVTHEKELETKQKKLEAELRELATYDVTGAYSRSALEFKLEELRISRGYPMGAVFIDVDGMKEINDKRGHTAGDKVLVDVVTLLKCGAVGNSDLAQQSALRGSDIVGRYGGDEFVIPLPDTDADGLAKVIKRINDTFDIFNLSNPEPILVSVGGAVVDGPEAFDTLVKSADDNMYEVKRKKQKESSKPQLPSQLDE